MNKISVYPKTIIVLLVGFLFVMIAILCTTWVFDIQQSHQSTNVMANNITIITGNFLLTGLWIGAVGTIAGGIGLLILDVQSSNLTHEKQEVNNNDS